MSDPTPQWEREHFEEVKAWLIAELTNGHTEPLDHEVTDIEVYEAEDDWEEAQEAAISAGW